MKNWTSLEQNVLKEEWLMPKIMANAQITNIFWFISLGSDFLYGEFSRSLI